MSRDDAPHLRPEPRPEAREDSGGLPVPPQHGHEGDDIKSTAILGFAIGIAVLIGIGLLVSFGLLRAENRVRQDGTSAEILTSPLATPVPRGPRLETSPYQNLDDFLKQKGSRLQSYGWVDRGHGIVHIPIARALELVSRRGLPTFGPPAAAPKTPQAQTTEELGPIESVGAQPAATGQATGEPSAERPLRARQPQQVVSGVKATGPQPEPGVKGGPR